jgi:hypothetical protein
MLRATKTVTAPNSKTHLSVGVMIMWMVCVAMVRLLSFLAEVEIFNYGPFKQGRRNLQLWV